MEKNGIERGDIKNDSFFTFFFIFPSSTSSPVSSILHTKIYPTFFLIWNKKFWKKIHQKNEKMWRIDAIAMENGIFPRVVWVERLFLCENFPPLSIEEKCVASFNFSSASSHSSRLSTCSSAGMRTICSTSGWGRFNNSYFFSRRITGLVQMMILLTWSLWKVY